jgi:hypothetical protein
MATARLGQMSDGDRQPAPARGTTITLVASNAEGLGRLAPAATARWGGDVIML